MRASRIGLIGAALGAVVVLALLAAGLLTAASPIAGIQGSGGAVAGIQGTGK